MNTSSTFNAVPLLIRLTDCDLSRDGEIRMSLYQFSAIVH